MFVRFRQSRSRLQVSLLETRRIDGKVRNEHVASFGPVDVPPTVPERLAFWQRLHERLANLANRIDATTQAKIYGDIHPRIPMVTADEQRALQLRNAQADEQLWTTLRGMVEDKVAGHQEIADLAERSIMNAKPVMKDADAKAASARDRIDRLKKGEAVSGGLGKPQTREDVVALLGLSASQVRHMMGIADLSKLIGFDEMLDEIRMSKDRAERATVPRLLKKKRAGAER